MYIQNAISEIYNSEVKLWHSKAIVLNKTKGEIKMHINEFVKAILHATESLNTIKHYLGKSE